jgi:EAL domain-containing protein (putative c-di-GMP-specific phosphodiesterase class I)
MAAISSVMGYTSIAEGVETPEEAADLVGLDYGYAQGFLYSRPVDAAQINALLESDDPLDPITLSMG